MENSKTISLAHATNNGIIFYSDKCPLIGTFVYYDDSNNIKTKRVFTKIFDLQYVINTRTKLEKFLNKKNITIFNIFLTIFSALLACVTTNFHFLTGAIYFSIFVSFDFFHLLSKIINLHTIDKNNHSVAKFHSAEHMSIAAYHSLQEIPTLDDVKKFSRFSKYCGSRVILSKTTTLLLMCITMTFLPRINMLLYIIVLALLLMLSSLDIKTGCLSFLQVLVTSPPSNEELLLAIEGIRQFEITEEQFLNNPTTLLEEVIEEGTNSLEELMADTSEAFEII